MNKKPLKKGKQEEAGQGEDKFLVIDRKTKGERGCWSPNMMLEFQTVSENKQRLKISQLLCIITWKNVKRESCCVK